jgi:hypothetical protein
MPGVPINSNPVLDAHGAGGPEHARRTHSQTTHCRHLALVDEYTNARPPSRTLGTGLGAAGARRGTRTYSLASESYAPCTRKSGDRELWVNSSRRELCRRIGRPLRHVNVPASQPILLASGSRSTFLLLEEPKEGPVSQGQCARRHVRLGESHEAHFRLSYAPLQRTLRRT